MKKTLLLLFFFGFTPFLNAQTLLASVDLELKKSSEHHQTLSFSNTKTNELYVIGSDKDNTTALHFNSAVFFKDSLRSATPDKKTPWLCGFSFSNNNPVVYWSSDDYKNIRSSAFDFKTRTVSERAYNFDFTDEILLNVFSENNTFYLFSMLEDKEDLKLYVFEKNLLFEKTIDLSQIKFYDAKNRPVKLSQLLETNPLVKMETSSMNPLSNTIRKSKFYVYEDRLMITFDHLHSETQILTINLKDFTVVSTSIRKPSLKESSEDSNSFLQNDRLYQLKTNKKELVFTTTDLSSGSLIQSFTAKDDADIAFRNSPLLVQTGNQQPKNVKTSKKFLKRLESGEVGVSVYNHRGDFLVTIGGQRVVATGSDVFVGLSVGMAGLIAGVDPFDIIDVVTYQTVYFETHFDPNGNYLKKQQEPLASDGIAQFLYENRVGTLSNSFAYKDYFVLGYYDKKAKKYVLRKFEDF